MRSWTFWIASLALSGVLLAPPAAGAADAVVGGKGPRVRLPHRPPVAAGGQPVFVVVDEFAAFGDLDVAEAPPLSIRVEGDVDVILLPDGSLRFVLGGEGE
jgi:hypothetical protein